jgi:chemotaxis regulatin CheY-phosphate phosphatase CheZ
MQPTPLDVSRVDAPKRLVDHALEELTASGAQLDRDARDFVSHVCNQPGGFDALSRTLLRAYSESVGIAERMREGRLVMEQATMEKLRLMDGKLDEISSATEIATTDILNGLNKSVGLVDAVLENDGGAESRAVALTNLRDELYGVMEHLQFQDITAQQLKHMSSMLYEIRSRMNVLVKVFAPYMMADPMAPVAQALEGTFDPNATTANATDRQAVADEVYAAIKFPKSA